MLTRRASEGDVKWSVRQEMMRLAAGRRVNFQSHEETRVSDDAQRDALCELNDEIMSILHAEQLRHDSVDSATVLQWLRGLYDVVKVGLGQSPHFNQQKSDER